MKNLQKKNHLLIVVIAISLLFSSCNGGRNQEENKEKEMEEKMMMAGYMDIKEALFNDNANDVQKEAKKIIESEEITDEIKTNVAQIANTSDIMEQRQHFANLSEQLYSMAKNKGVDRTLYVSHCPMALNNQGANWLSYEEKIRNPYMGQSMPECGSVQETIN